MGLSVVRVRVHFISPRPNEVKSTKSPVQSNLICNGDQTIYLNIFRTGSLSAAIELAILRLYDRVYTCENVIGKVEPESKLFHVTNKVGVPQFRTFH